MTKFLNKASLTIFCISVGFFFICPQANAQYGQKRKYGGTKKYDGKKKEQESQFQRTKLDRPVSLPDVPQYTGKQIFVSGLAYPNNKSGPGWMMVFNTEHTQDQVISWWKNALRMGSWKIQNSGQKNVRAKSREGHMVSVSVEAVRPSTKKKMKKCRACYTIFYHQIKKR